ncbi:MAG TPA: YIP1 family protein [Spirochaetota bacterium]|nr:YIP1 family protein [Spirochaetota bacterium]HPC40719.1 YIP1 family protein [Spirochaetota bacterium]HPL18938.1 YIP1 family protein [Spirochaetota bacterium]HQF09372.1 YIP1 family protein [Spirochaetota bacterium]HQH98014.1 YIP1 family protein [Spirochaetota bacterium]
MIIAELRSLRWTDLFLYALLDPRALYRQIDRQEPRSLALSFVMPVAVAVIDILTMSVMGKETPFFFYKITYGWIFMALYHALAVVISAALMDAAAQFFGYKGNIRDLIILVNFSLFPKIFILPLVYIFKVFNFAPLFFYAFFSLGLLVWSALIAVQGISEMHSAGFGKAFVIYIFPALLVGVTLFFMLVLLVICGVGYLAG